MKCSDFDDRISLFMDGEMEKEETEGWKAHLDECPTCAGKLDQAATVDGLIASIPDPPPGLMTAQHLMTHGKTRQKNARLKLAGAIAAVLVIVAGLFFARTAINMPGNMGPSPIQFVSLREKPDLSYRIELNDSRYEMKIWGEEVTLLSCHVSEKSETSQAELSIGLENKKP